MDFLFIGGGAALGAICRYDLTKVIKRHATGKFPWATLCINLLGTIFLGLMAGLLLSTSKAYLFAGIGFCGGFTTFSTMSYEAMTLWHKHNKTSAFLYLGSTVVLGVICFMLAFQFAR